MYAGLPFRALSVRRNAAAVATKFCEILNKNRTRRIRPTKVRCAVYATKGICMNKKQKRTRNRIVAALAIFAVVFAVTEFVPLAQYVGGETNALYLEFVLFLIPYLIAGYDVLLKAARNIGNGQVFDENFLMTIATVGAFALVLFPDSQPHMAEGAAVMLFYQVGELFQGYAVGKSRQSHRRHDGHRPRLRQRYA